MTPGTNTFTLNVLTSGTSTNRMWNILIRQIPCGTAYTAPDGCLQWYTDSAGTITSYNFQYAAAPAVQHLAYQDYAICIRMNQVNTADVAHDAACLAFHLSNSLNFRSKFTSVLNSGFLRYQVRRLQHELSVIWTVTKSRKWFWKRRNRFGLYNRLAANPLCLRFAK